MSVVLFRPVGSLYSSDKLDKLEYIHLLHFYNLGYNLNVI